MRRVIRAKGKIKEFPKVFDGDNAFVRYFPPAFFPEDYQRIFLSFKDLDVVEKALQSFGVPYWFWNGDAYETDKRSIIVSNMYISLEEVVRSFLFNRDLFCNRPSTICFGGPISFAKEEGQFILKQELYILKGVTNNDYNRLYPYTDGGDSGSITVSGSITIGGSTWGMDYGNPFTYSTSTNLIVTPLTLTADPSSVNNNNTLESITTQLHEVFGIAPSMCSMGTFQHASGSNV